MVSILGSCNICSECSMKQTEKPGFVLCWVYTLELRLTAGIHNSPGSLRPPGKSRREESGKLLKGGVFVLVMREARSRLNAQKYKFPGDCRARPGLLGSEIESVLVGIDSQSPPPIKTYCTLNLLCWSFIRASGSFQLVTALQDGSKGRHWLTIRHEGK